MSPQRYRSATTKSFIKEYRKLPRDVRERIFEATREMLENPYAGVKLRGEYEGLLRWRIGKYRIIYLVDEDQKQVVLLDVGSRKAIYE